MIFENVFSMFLCDSKKSRFDTSNSLFLLKGSETKQKAHLFSPYKVGTKHDVLFS